MLKFKPVILNKEKGEYQNLEYIPQIMFLYKRWGRFLKDDFALQEDSFYEYFMDLLEELSPYFWVILCGSEVAGFVYLENFVGNSENLYSAEVSTCFDKKFWGKFTYYAALVFFDFCFANLGLKKIKALIYPENFRVLGLLKRAGFKKEGFLKSETMRFGRPQNIEVYSLFNNIYDRKGSKWK